MFGLELAPFIIAGLLCLLGYAVARWSSNIGQIRLWVDLANGQQDTIDAMKAEGCRAMGALENIFNGVTACGMPHSKLVKKVADVATDALVLCAPCGHKEEVEDLREAVVAAEAEVERLAGELIVAKRNSEGWQNLAVESEARMVEAERLLARANDRLVVEKSMRRL